MGFLEYFGYGLLSAAVCVFMLMIFKMINEDFKKKADTFGGGEGLEYFPTAIVAFFFWPFTLSLCVLLTLLLSPIGQNLISKLKKD